MAACAGPNRLLGVPSLRNKFCALRHGQSLANVAGIISSDPAISTKQHGLSDFGKEQARDAGIQFARGITSNDGQQQYRGVAVYSSDFTRAKETAQLMADAISEASVPLYKGGVILETRLRERNFGDLNGGQDSHYQNVWDVDAVNPDHKEFGVESVNSVLERTTGLVVEIDEELCGATMSGEVDCTLPWKCVLVAHGDVLQILQTGFRRMDGSLHRTLPHLETATVRDLVLDNGLCGYFAKSS